MLTLITAPASAVLTLTQAKLQCRVPTAVTNEDDLFNQIILPAAEERCETSTKRQLITATYELWLRGFPCDYIDVPRPPLASVTSIKYLDTAGVEQTLAATEYVVRAPAGRRSARGRIELAYGKSWPSTRDQMDAVKVRFSCGYGTNASAVPALLKQAMLQDVGTLFLHREEIVTDVTPVAIPNGAAAIYRSFESHPPKRAAD